MTSMECDQAVYAQGWPAAYWARIALNSVAPLRRARVSFELEVVIAKLPDRSADCVYIPLSEVDHQREVDICVVDAKGPVPLRDRRVTTKKQFRVLGVVPTTGCRG